MNRLLQLIILFSFFTNETKSQFAIAGVNGGIHVDIVPDTLLYVTPFPPYEEYYYIDINNDGTNDIKIDAYCSGALGNPYESVTISSLDSNTSFSFGSIDSTYFSTQWCGSYWVIRTILKVYNIGDTIKNGNYVSSGFLGYFNALASPCSVSANSPEWINQGDVFFGVKYQTSSDTSYGWVKVNEPDHYRIYIKEFSLGSPLNGINELDINKIINIYPNPTKNKFSIKTNSKFINAQIEIFNVVGEKVYSEKLTDMNIHFNASSGIYIVKVSDEDKMFIQKLIVE